jgi:hypothetical protein
MDKPPVLAAFDPVGESGVKPSGEDGFGKAWYTLQMLTATITMAAINIQTRYRLKKGIGSVAMVFTFYMTTFWTSHIIFSLRHRRPYNPIRSFCNRQKEALK